MGIMTRRVERKQREVRRVVIKAQAILGLLLHQGIQEENDDVVYAIIEEHLGGDPSGMGGLLARGLGAALNFAGYDPDSEDTAHQMALHILGLSLGDVNPPARTGFKLFMAGAKKDHEEYDRIIEEELDGDEGEVAIVVQHALSGVLAIICARAELDSLFEASSLVIASLSRQ